MVLGNTAGRAAGLTSKFYSPFPPVSGPGFTEVTLNNIWMSGQKGGPALQLTGTGDTYFDGENYLVVQDTTTNSGGILEISAPGVNSMSLNGALRTEDQTSPAIAGLCAIDIDGVNTFIQGGTFAGSLNTGSNNGVGVCASGSGDTINGVNWSFGQSSVASLFNFPGTIKNSNFQMGDLNNTSFGNLGTFGPASYLYNEFTTQAQIEAGIANIQPDSTICGSDGCSTIAPVLAGASGTVNFQGGSIGAIASGIFSNLLNNSIVGTGSTWSSVGADAYASVTYNTMDVIDPYGGNTATKLVGSVTAPTTGNFITGTISPPIPINTSLQVCVFLYNPAGIQTAIFLGGGGGGAAVLPGQTSLWPYTCVTINTGSAPVDSIVFASYTAGGALYLYGFNISLTATPSAGFDVTGPSADPTPHFGYSPRFPVISGNPTPTNCANWATAGTLGDAGAPCGGSGTVSTGGSYALPAYASAGGTTVAPSNITTDATGNNLNVPGALALTGPTHGITISAGTQVGGAAGKVIYGSDGGSTGLAEANENNGGYSRLCTAANGICAAPPTTGLATLSSGTVTVSNAAACTPAATGCTYKLTNCDTNGSAALGILTIGTVSAGTSFVINSESLTNTVVTTDASKVCWAIN
jgi:hypothetical protein